MMNAFVLFILASACVVHGFSFESNELQNERDGELICRVTVERSWRVNALGETESDQKAACIPVTEEDEDDEIYELNLPDWFVTAHTNQISHGSLYVKITGGRISHDRVYIPTNAEITVVDPLQLQLPVASRRLQQNVGSRKLMVARISLSDAQVGVSTADLESYIFGSSSSVSVANQFKGCSSSKLTIEPSSLGGVVDIMVNKSISEFSSWRLLRNEAAAALKNFVGTSQLSTIADYVMLCLPPGSWNFGASATPGYWRSAFDNENCGYLSVVMHQLGYSMSLTDSNEVRPLDDTTCYMGQTSSEFGGPQKCFNAQKHWMLGWFSDKAVTVNPTTTPQVFSLASFLDYSSTASTDAVVLNVGTLYLQYNRAKGFNVGTGENKDQVVVVQAQSNGQSEKLAGLGSQGPAFSIANFANGLNLTIEVCQFDSSRLDIATVSIALGSCACSCSSSAAPTGVTATNAPSGAVATTLAPSSLATTQTAANSSTAPSQTPGGTAALPAPGFITASPSAAAPQESLMPVSGFLTLSPSAAASPPASLPTTSPSAAGQPPGVLPTLTTISPVNSSSTAPSSTISLVNTSSTAPSSPPTTSSATSEAPTASPTVTTTSTAPAVLPTAATIVPGNTSSIATSSPTSPTVATLPPGNTSSIVTSSPTLPMATSSPTVPTAIPGNESSTSPSTPVMSPSTNSSSRSPSHPSGLSHPSASPLFNNSIPTMKPSVFPIRGNSSLSPRVKTLYPTPAHDALEPVKDSAAASRSRISLAGVAFTVLWLLL